MGLLTKTQEEQVEKPISDMSIEELESLGRDLVDKAQALKQEQEAQAIPKSVLGVNMGELKKELQLIKGAIDGIREKPDWATSLEGKMEEVIDAIEKFRRPTGLFLIAILVINILILARVLI